jgi:hypothetical protein
LALDLSLLQVFSSVNGLEVSTLISTFGQAYKV